MKQDLDRLMAARGLDALVISGKMLGNPTLYYMSNGAQALAGQVVKKRGENLIFLSAPIEREVAALSGLTVIPTSRYDLVGILREKPSCLEAMVEFYRRVFADLGIRGKVGFYGMADQGTAWRLLNALGEQIEGIEIYGEDEPTLIDVARATKDAVEAERIREMGRRTAAVVGETLIFLKSHRVHDGALVQSDGKPLTIGRVHQEIKRFLAEHGMDVPEGIIFAIGRDAGVPHNHGNPTDVVKLGQSIIYDFGTREAGGGYYYDMTRSFCLGFAPPEIEKAYRDVYDCVAMLGKAYKAGVETRTLMLMACDFFESRGHPTIASNTKTESGFVHGLGHGIGLAVHEQPFFSIAPSENTVLQPGHIFTCEPGLYYPDRGYGVRIEDVFWIDGSGAAQDLTDFPKELVVKM